MHLVFPCMPGESYCRRLRYFFLFNLYKKSDSVFMHMNISIQTKDTHKFKVNVNILNQLTNLCNRDSGLCCCVCVTFFEC